MSWIESHQSLSRHKKTMRAASLLKVDRHKLIGHLHELWWWGLDNADIDGRLDGLTALEIAAGADWPIKDAERFTNALVEAEFIDRHDDGYILHNWYEYAGKLNAQRARNAQRQREFRQRSPLRDKHPDALHDTSRDALRNSYVTGLPVTGLPDQPYQPDQPTEVTSVTSAPKRGPTKAKRPEEKLLTEDERRCLERDFGELPHLSEEIEFALSHKAREKATNEYLYLRNWLRRTLERQPKGNLNGTGYAATGTRPGGNPRGTPTVTQQLKAAGVIDD